MAISSPERTFPWERVNFFSFFIVFADTITLVSLPKLVDAASMFKTQVPMKANAKICFFFIIFIV